jgi:hypothetical protein
LDGLLEYVAPQRYVFHANGTEAYRAVAQKHRHVWGGFVVVVTESRAYGRHVEIFWREPEETRQVLSIHEVFFARQWGVGEAVWSDDFGSYSLSNSFGVLAIVQQGSIGVGMCVDKAWGDYMA